MVFMVNIQVVEFHVNILLGTPKGLRSSNEFRQNMYKVESTADQYKVVENYFNHLLDHGQIMSDVQVDQVNCASKPNNLSEMNLFFFLY